MTKKTIPTVKIYDLETGEEVERPMNAAELEDYESLQKSAADRKAEQLAKEAARQSALEKLAALGLTEAEIQALAG